MATNPYSYGSLGQRWTVGEPTSKSLLDVSRVKADANRWALEQLIVDPDDTANFVLTAPGLNIDSNTLYVDSVYNSVGFRLTNPNDYAFNGTPSWVASGGAGNASVILVSGTTSIGYFAFADGTTGTDRYSGNIQYNHSTNTMSFNTNGGVEAMTINSAQDLAVDTDTLFVDASADRVGINSASPGETLTVVGGGSTTSTANFTGGAAANDNSTLASDYGMFFQIDANNTVGGRTYNWRVGGKGYSDGTSLMTLNASGNLTLQTNQGAETALAIYNTNSSASAKASLKVGYNSSNHLHIYRAGNAAGIVYNATQSGSSHKFQIAGSTRLTILSGGDVGLGTESPEIRLSVTDTYNGSALTSNDIPAVQIINEQGSYTADNVLGVLGFGKSQGFASGVRAGMVAYYSGTGSQSSNVGAYLAFRTSADGAGDSTERLRILSSGGITFNGDTATANALDDYEEGTWTPVLTFGTTAPSSVSYGTRLGGYTKIGNMVFVTIDLTVSSYSGGSGSFQIQGLPFNTDTANGRGTASGRAVYGVTYTSSISWEFTGNRIYAGHVNTDLQQSAFSTSGFRFIISGVYRAS